MVVDEKHVGLGSTFDETAGLSKLFELNREHWAHGQIDALENNLCEYRNSSPNPNP